MKPKLLFWWPLFRDRGGSSTGGIFTYYNRSTSLYCTSRAGPHDGDIGPRRNNSRNSVRLIRTDKRNLRWHLYKWEMIFLLISSVLLNKCNIFPLVYLKWKAGEEKAKKSFYGPQLTSRLRLIRMFVITFFLETNPFNWNCLKKFQERFMWLENQNSVHISYGICYHVMIACTVFSHNSLYQKTHTHTLTHTHSHTHTHIAFPNESPLSFRLAGYLNSYVDSEG